MSLLQLIWVVAIFVLAVVSKKAIELILEKEYGSWAPALARLLVRLAGLLCRSRRGPWWADLLYVQRIDQESGLGQAGSCLVSAPWLALRSLVVRRDPGRVVRLVLEGSIAGSIGLCASLVLFSTVNRRIFLTPTAATTHEIQWAPLVVWLVELLLSGCLPMIVLLGLDAGVAAYLRRRRHAVEQKAQ